MREPKIEILAEGNGFIVYKYKKMYFVDTAAAFDQGFKTMQGVTEYLYYQGYIPTKEKKHWRN